MSVSLESWLKNLVDEITSEILKSRAYEPYFNKVYCNSDPFYTWKNEPPRVVTRYGVNITEIPPSITTLTSPKTINLEYPGDWKEWYEEQTIVCVDHVYREAILQEKTYVAETLMKDLEEIELKSVDFNEIRKVQEIIERHDKISDVFLVHPIKLTLLLQNKNFRHESIMQPNYVESKGIDFVGELGPLSVYQTFGLPKNVGLIYNRGSAYLRIHPLEVGFDSYKNPKILRISEKLYAWFDEDGVGIKVIFKSN